MSRRWAIGLAVGASVLAAVLFVFDPVTAGFFPPCVFRQLTGWDCPGCGSTRALHALMHGELGRAFSLNPLLVSSLPLLAVLALRRSPIQARPAVLTVLVVTILSFGVLRNVTAFAP